MAVGNAEESRQDSGDPSGERGGQGAGELEARATFCGIRAGGEGAGSGKEAREGEEE